MKKERKKRTRGGSALEIETCLSLAKCQQGDNQMKTEAVHWVHQVALLSSPAKHDHNDLSRERNSPQKPAKRVFALWFNPGTVESWDEPYGDTKLNH